MATARGLYSKYGTIHGFCTTMNQESILHPPFVLHFNNQASCYLTFPICGFVFFFLFALRWTKFIQKMILLKLKSASKKTLTCIAAPAFSCALLQWYIYIVLIYWCIGLFMFLYIDALIYFCFDVLMHWCIDTFIHAADYKLLIPSIQTLLWR